MFLADANISKLIKRGSLGLDRFSDEWINCLRAERVAGSQGLPDQHIRVLTELIRSGEKECCQFSAK